MPRFVFIGDFSGLSMFLARGLDKLGHDVLQLSNGDHWKNIPRSMNLWRPAKGRLGTVANQILGFPSLLKQISKNDVVVMATEYLYYRAINGLMLTRLFERAGKVVLLHAGRTEGFNAKHDASMLCTSCKLYDLQKKDCKFRHVFWARQNVALSQINTVVPFTSIYQETAESYLAFGAKVTEPIHFPIDIQYLHSQSEIGPISGATPVIHGLNRPGFKGTAHLQKLIAETPGLSELIRITPRMPFAEYLRVISGADVVLDQFLSGGYGMNGAISLALGRAVLFGHLTDAPPVDFTGDGCISVKISLDVGADGKAVRDALENYLSSKSHPDDLREFCRKRHDHLLVSEQFLERISGDIRCLS